MVASRVIAACIGLTITAGSTLSAQTDDWFGRPSVVRFDEPFEVPKAVIEPGTYVFRLLSIDAHRKIVQIFNRDESQLLASFLAVRDYRQRPEVDTVIVFHEQVSEGLRPVRTWYLEHEMYGYEFVYPTSRATEIAKDGDGYVLAANSNDDPVRAIIHNGIRITILDALPRTQEGKAAESVK